MQTPKNFDLFLLDEKEMMANKKKINIFVIWH